MICVSSAVASGSASGTTGGVPLRLRVLDTVWIGPNRLRITATCTGVAEMALHDTDLFVRALFPRPGTACPRPPDLIEGRLIPQPPDRPAQRPCTVRRVDPGSAEIVLEVGPPGTVAPGDPWAASRPFRDDPIRAADWHLLVGEAASLPQIGAALARIPAGRTAIAVLEMSDLTAAHRVTSPGELTVHWLYPGRALLGTGRALLTAVRALDFPPGQVHAVVAGEAAWVREVGRHLLVERGIGRDWVSVSDRRQARARAEQGGAG